MLVTTPQQPFPHGAVAQPIPHEGRSGNYVVISLPACPDSGRRARAVVRNALESWGLSRSLADAELVITELVANAVTHGAPGRSEGATVVVEAQRSDRALRVAVTDDSPDAVPMVRAAGVDEESGRGLLLVTEVSSAWGWRPVAYGRSKQVWAEFELDTNPS
ncbi:ATP-binding protein [Streptomyces sp. NPDC127098]|uniref:ATP-binding protein n=1 Tax=Streptomyces sp. NPDC127098 TaxID=3347137 RepID=UPI0036529B11